MRVNTPGARNLVMLAGTGQTPRGHHRM